MSGLTDADSHWVPPIVALVVWVVGLLVFVSTLFPWARDPYATRGFRLAIWVARLGFVGATVAFTFAYVWHP